VRSGVAALGIAGLEVGVLRIADVAAALGPDFPLAKTIEVLVPTTDGLPFAGVVRLVDKPSGLGTHHALACPQCGAPKFKLLVFDGGRLGCSKCAHKHPRRNAERTCASWNLGGREEDRLLRLVAGRSKPTTVAVERAVRLAHELVHGDEDRAAAVLQIGETAVTAVERHHHEHDRAEHAR